MFPRQLEYLVKDEKELNGLKSILPEFIRDYNIETSGYVCARKLHKTKPKEDIELFPRDDIPINGISPFDSDNQVGKIIHSDLTKAVIDYKDKIIVVTYNHLLSSD
jgi:hypothetical protein